MNQTLKIYRSNMDNTLADITALVGVYNDALDFIEEKGLSDDFVLFHIHRDLYRAKQELEKDKGDAETADDTES